MLADWDAAIDASDEHEQQLVEASKRVDAVLCERERYRQLVEADRSGRRRWRARPARAAGAAGERGGPARSCAGRSHHRVGGPPRLALLPPPRPASRGRDVNDNEIAKVLRESLDRAERREAWEASKSIGPQAAPLVRELAHLRNEAARALGYRDHFVFSLTLEELDETWLLSLLDDLDVRLAADLGAHEGRDRRRASARASGSPRTQPLEPWDYRRRVLPGRARRQRRPARGGARAPRSGRGRAHLLPRARRRRRRRAGAQRPLPARRQEPARVLRRHRPPPRRAHPRELRARHPLARARWCTSSGTPSTTSRSTPSCPGCCARPRTRSRPRRSRCCTAASCATRRSSSASRASTPAIARDARNAEMQRRELLVFVPWVQVMTRFERELYRDPDQDLGRGLVAARRALPAHHAAVGRATRRLGLQDPRRAGAGLLPELPAGRGHGLAAGAARWRARPVPRARPSSPPPRAGSCASASCARASSMRWDALIAHATGEPLTVDHLAGTGSANSSRTTREDRRAVHDRRAVQERRSAARLPPPARRTAAGSPTACATSTAGSSRTSTAASRSWSATTRRCCSSGCCTGRASPTSRSSRSSRSAETRAVVEPLL